METITKFKQLRDVPVGAEVDVNLVYNDWGTGEKVPVSGTIRVVEDLKGCEGCIFTKSANCMENWTCTPAWRKDGKTVVYRKV